MHITILDGGIGHLLKERDTRTSVLNDKDLASSFLVPALANKDAPDAVRQVHHDYIDAGADIITVNNFPVTEWSLARAHREAEITELTQLAASLAREAVSHGKSAGRRVLVAGVLPPAGESYQVQALSQLEAGQPALSEIATTLAPFVDLLICETMASAAEAAIAATVASASGRPFWVSLTIEDSEAGVLRSGESLEDAVEQIAEIPGLAAVLLNCSSPQAITAALPKLRAATACRGLAIGAYANGFQRTTSEWLAAGGAPISGVLMSNKEDYTEKRLGKKTIGIITAQAYVRHAQQWVAAGASIVGGCCGIGPEHIRALRAALKPDAVPPS